MQALLTEWRRNTTNCICPASGYKTLPAVVNILILMVLLGTTITSVKAVAVTSGTDNDRVLKLLLKKLSFKSGTDSQRRLTGEEPEMPMTLFPSVGSCHPTIPSSTFVRWILPSNRPFLYFWLVCVGSFLLPSNYASLPLSTFVQCTLGCVIQPYLSLLSYIRMCCPTVPFSTFGMVSVCILLCCLITQKLSVWQIHQVSIFSGVH